MTASRPTAHALSAESAQAMRTVTFDLGIPQTPPMGLGWWLPPIAGTTAASHLGGSPGGISSFCILPEHDAVVISFATGPGGLFGPGGFSLHDVLHNAVIEELTGQKPTAPVDLSAEHVPAEDFAGEYVSFEKRLVIEADDDDLRATDHYVAYNDDQRETHDVYAGSATEAQPTPCTRVGPNAFAIAGTEPEALAGLVGRLGLLSRLSEGPGRRAGVHHWLRYTPKVA